MRDAIKARDFCQRDTFRGIVIKMKEETDLNWIHSIKNILNVFRVGIKIFMLFSWILEWWRGFHTIDLHMNKKDNNTRVFWNFKLLLPFLACLLFGTAFPDKHLVSILPLVETLSNARKRMPESDQVPRKNACWVFPFKFSLPYLLNLYAAWFRCLNTNVIPNKLITYFQVFKKGFWGYSI